MTKCCLGPWLKTTNFWRNPCPKLKSFLGKVYSLKSDITRGLNEAAAKGSIFQILIARFLKCVHERNQQLLLAIMTP